MGEKKREKLVSYISKLLKEIMKKIPEGRKEEIIVPCDGSEIYQRIVLGNWGAKISTMDERHVVYNIEEGAKRLANHPNIEKLIEELEKLSSKYKH